MNSTTSNSGTVDLEELRKYAEQWNKEHKQPVQSTCPNCGYCPHCGRGGYQTYPYSPYPWYGPTWVTCDNTKY